MAEEMPMQPETEQLPTEEPVAEAEQAQDDQLTPEELDEARANEVTFSWEASEYVHHHKGMGWYMGLVGLMVVPVALAVWLELWLTLAAFGAMAAAIVVYARRPPRTLLYELSQKGIKVDGKDYPYAEFRSFGVLKDLEWHTIDLEPIKRFSLRVSILFNSDDFDSIVGHLELHLPRTDRDPDVIERLTRLARF